MTDRLTDDELTEIEERANGWLTGDYRVSVPQMRTACMDVRHLLAEIRALRAERAEALAAIEQVRAWVDLAQTAYGMGGVLPPAELLAILDGATS